MGIESIKDRINKRGLSVMLMNEISDYINNGDILGGYEEMLGLLWEIRCKLDCMDMSYLKDKCKVMWNKITNSYIDKISECIDSDSVSVDKCIEIMVDVVSELNYNISEMAGYKGLKAVVLRRVCRYIMSKDKGIKLEDRVGLLDRMPLWLIEELGLNGYRDIIIGLGDSLFSVNNISNIDKEKVYKDVQYLNNVYTKCVYGKGYYDKLEEERLAEEERKRLEEERLKAEEEEKLRKQKEEEMKRREAEEAERRRKYREEHPYEGSWIYSEIDIRPQWVIDAEFERVWQEWIEDVDASVAAAKAQARADGEVGPW